MTAQEHIARAIRDAQIILARYLQPGPRNAEQTINELFDVLDDNDLIASLEAVDAGLIDSPGTAPDFVRQDPADTASPPTVAVPS